MTIELLRRSLEMIGRLRDDLNGMEDNESLELSLYSIDLENQISAALSQPASEDTWLVEAERLYVAARTFLIVDHRDADADSFTANAEADAKFRAHLRVRPAPEGFVLVPVEPTEEMVRAGAGHFAVAVSPREFAAMSYRSMIETAKESGK